MHRFLLAAVIAAVAVPLHAADRYKIDTQGAHAFIQFKIAHLGFSWLWGRFNDFEGEFVFDPENPENSSVEVTIDTASVDSNHQRRDDHLRNEDFLTVEEYPQATFKSTAFRHVEGDNYVLSGDLTLLDTTRSIDIDVTHLNTGPDAWGGYRSGFEGSTKLALADFGIDYDLDEASREVEIILSLEGIRQDSENQE